MHGQELSSPAAFWLPGYLEVYFMDLSDNEERLVEKHKDLLDRQDNTISDSRIKRYQIQRKAIRDKLVEDFEWERKEANELADGG